LLASLIGYAECVEQLRSPDEVLEELNNVTTRHLPLSVLCAVRLPLKAGDWASVPLEKLTFLHKSAPKGWWDEYNALASGKFRPVLFLATSCVGMHTWTEMRRMFQPVGIDNWTYDLALKHGMRDGLAYSAGGRWMVAFWSRKELSNILSQPLRIIVSIAAGFAAGRLEQLAPPDPNLVGPHVQLTPRELAVLRLVGSGMQYREIAEVLGVGEETVRSHQKKAQAKLGARNRAQAVAEAVRQRLIP
jgi:DNA-binding CsgD family transcriptional regulator